MWWPWNLDVTDFGFFLVMVMHVVLCPYTKVEESFNLQAMHDIIYHGSNLSEYDHLEFPGVVPRSFIGPLVVTSILQPIDFFKNSFMSPLEFKFANQIRVRVLLGLLVLVALWKYKQTISKQFGKSVGKWLMLITCTQFHFMFYMSRPLPNIFALILVLYAIERWISGDHCTFILSSAFTIIVFRFEVCLLLGLILFMELWSRRLIFTNLFKYAIPSGVISLGVTILIDSYYWRRWLWPEGEVLWYNTILNKSSNWGTQPFFWYFYSALPRCLSGSLPLVAMGLYMDKRAGILALPCFGFVFLYSFLPHKELRFIIYVLPVLNTVAALSAQRVFHNRRKTFFWTMLCFYAIGHIVLNMTATAGFTYLSYYNYPGGHAIHKLHHIESPNQDVHVHMDVFSCQTGISRFTQLHNSWKYNKTEDLEPGGVEMLRYSHLLLMSSDAHIYEKTHDVIDTIYGYSGVQISKPFFQIIFDPKINILRNKLYKKIMET